MDFRRKKFEAISEKKEEEEETGGDWLCFGRSCVFIETLKEGIYWGKGKFRCKKKEKN